MKSKLQLLLTFALLLLFNVSYGSTPVVTSILPADNATGVVLQPTVRVNFNQTISVNAGYSFAIREKKAQFQNQDPWAATFSLNHAAVTVGSNYVSANLSAAGISLEYNKEYYVYLQSSAVEDAAGTNSFGGFTDRTTWSFITVNDPDAANITSIYPAHNATNIPIKDVFTITFDEPIQRGTGFPTIKKTDNSVAVAITSDQIIFSGNTLSIPFDYVTIRNNTEYYISIPQGFIESVDDGHPYPEISMHRWRFTTRVTPDGEAPTITSSSPIDNATNIPKDIDTFTLTYSEDLAYRMGGSFSLWTGGGAIGGFNITVDGNTITLVRNNSLAEPLQYGTLYFITYTNSSNGQPLIMDHTGTEIAASPSIAWLRFTTEPDPNADVTPPVLLSTSPADNAEDVALDDVLVLTFNEPIKAGNDYIGLFQPAGMDAIFGKIGDYPTIFNISGNQLTINLANANGESVGAGKNYWVDINPGAILDMSDNPFAGINDSETWNFTTEAAPAQDQTISFGSLPVKTFGDAPFGITAAASSGLPVTFTSTNTNVATVSGNTITIVGAGSTNIRANQSGNASFNAANQVQQTLSVSKADQFITMGALPAKNFGDAPFDISATASSGLSVTFSSTNTNVATVSGNTITIVGAGSTTINANQSGNVNYSAAGQVQKTLTVGNAVDLTPPTILSLSPAHQGTVGLSDNIVITFDKNVVSQNTIYTQRIRIWNKTTNGNTTFEDFDMTSGSESNRVSGLGTTQITIDPINDFEPGKAYGITLTRAFESESGQAFDGLKSIGDWDIASEAAPAQDQTITFGSLPVKTFGDVPFDITATASSGLPVTFTSTNTNVATVSGNTITIVGAGSTNIRANQSGNASFNAANQVQQTLYVIKADQLITLGVMPAKTFGDAPFAISATASSGLPVTFSSTNTNVATVSGNTITIVGAGSTTINANQSGNGNYNATSVQRSFDVGKAGQSISFATLPTKTFGDAPFDITATASSGLPVTFTSTNTSVATVSGNTITIVGAGSANIRANQSGNGNYNAAGQIQQTLTVGNEVDLTPPTILSLSPAANSIDVAIDTDFVFTFNEDIQQVDKGGRITIASGGGVLEYIFFGDSQLSIDGNVLTVNPKKLMFIETDYRISIEEGIIEDLAGNSFSSYQYLADELTTSSDFNFGTSKSPEDDATAVPTDIGEFSVTFDTDIQKSGNGVYEVQLKRISDNQIVKSWQISSEEVIVDGATVTFTNVPELDPNASYWIHKQYKESFTDLDDYEIWHPTYLNTHWNFTTGSASNSAPTDIALSATSITENNAINAVIGTFSTTDTDAGDSHAYSLVSGTGSTDNASFNIAGNQLRASAGFDYEIKNSFSIRVQTTDGTATYQKPFIITVNDEDDTAPTIASLMPINNATQVAVSSNLVVTFSEAITPAISSPNFIRLVDFDTDEVVENFDPENNSDGRVTISGNTITINPTNDLNHSKQYYLIFNADMLQDEVGNLYEGYNDKTTWSFTTEAAVAQDQTITFGSLPVKTFGDVPFGITATASSGLPVTFTSTNTNVATVSGNIITIVGAGSTTINANQSGNASFNAANQVQQTLSVSKADQLITLETLPAKTFGDAPFAISATASSGLPVSFTSTNTNVATVSGNTITIVGAGSTTINANQSGNGNFNATSVQRSFDVGKASQSISFATLPTKTFGDAPFDITATASSGLPVTFTSTNTSVATVSGNTITVVGAGSTNIRANQSGNGNYNAAGQVQKALSVGKANQTITINAIVDKSTTDGSFPVSATTTSGLSLNYGIESGPASISGTTITLNGSTGTVVVGVSQAGNANYNAANEAVSFNVSDPSKTNQTITFAGLPDKAFGSSSFELAATASSGLTVSYVSSNTSVATISGSTVTIAGVGSTIITASQSGNGTFNPASSVDQALTVTKADQSISITAIADKLTTDAAFDVAASTTSGLTLSYGIQSGPATLSGTTITLSGTAGTVVVEVSQAGNVNYNTASQTTSFNVTAPPKTDQTIDFGALASKTFGDAPFNLTASASSSLAVSYSVISGPVTLEGSEVTITGAGTAVIAANQTGNDEFNPATEVQQSFDIAKADQTITIETITNKLSTDAPFDVVATATSGLSLTYEVSGPANISGTTISLTGANGEVSVTVNQAGNENYNAATATTTFAVVGNRQLQTITFAEIGTQVYGTTFQLAANTDSDLPITFERLTGNMVLEGTMVTFTGVGTASIKALQTGNESYEAAEVIREFNITKAPLTVQADDQGRFVGATNPPLTITYSGFANGDNAGSLAEAPTTTTTATESSGIGTYPIIPQGGSSDVYSFDYTEGALTIMGATVTGQVQADNTALTEGTVTLWKKGPNNAFTMVDQTSLTNDGSFAIANVDAGSHTLSVTPSQADQASYFTSYLTATNELSQASTFDVTQGNPALIITMVNKPSAQGNGGQGSISGVLGSDPSATGGKILHTAALEEVDPITNTEIWLVDAAGTIVGNDITDEAGRYDFIGLSEGSYGLRLNSNGQLLDFSGATIDVSDSAAPVEITTLINDKGEIIVVPAVTTGIELPLISWEVYPNPATEVINVTIDTTGDWELRLHNLNGQLVYEKQVNRQTQLRVGHLPKGIYLLHLTDEGQGQQLHRRIVLK